MKLYIDNDQRLTLDELRLGTDDTPVNDATVTGRIEDSAGDLVVGSDITLVYEPGTDGRYSGLLEDSLPLTAGEIYTIRVAAETLSGLTLNCSVQLQAQERGCFAAC